MERFWVHTEFVKKMLPVLLIAAFLLPLAAHAEIKAGSVELSPFAGYNFYDSQHNIKDRPVFGGRIGYNFTKHFGLEGTAEFSKTRIDDRNKVATEQAQFTSPTDDVKITSYHLNLVYHFLPEQKFNPFVVAGFGASHYNPEINDGDMELLDYGAGAKYWLKENIALRVDLRDKMTFDEHLHNLSATAGIVFTFGGKPSTPADSDKDGVIDSLDKCPNTPAGVAVDKDGCPLDTDQDGVPDYLDKCPDTPTGVAVDANGCPLDADKDGVPDYLDKCPATPAGVAVDADGCPLDTDKDGVPDYLDKCPDTPAGVMVDKDGCPLVEEVKVVTAAPEAVAILEFEVVHFEFDKSILTPAAKVVLKRNVLLLQENPRVHIRIAGHASASGTEEYNQALSERRANSVKKFLVSEGVIEASRLSTIGYGETHPAAYEANPLDLYSDAAKANMRVDLEAVE